jgi:hypothetical protein
MLCVNTGEHLKPRQKSADALVSEIHEHVWPWTWNPEV